MLADGKLPIKCKFVWRDYVELRVMKNNDLKDLSVAELKEKLLSETEALRKMKFAHQVSAIENPIRIKATRRQIARINTLLHQKAQQK